MCVQNIAVIYSNEDLFCAKRYEFIFLNFCNRISGNNLQKFHHQRIKDVKDAKMIGE